MQQSPERWIAALRSLVVRLAAIALLALVGGLGGVHLRNDKGVVIVLQDPSPVWSLHQHQRDHDFAEEMTMRSIWIVRRGA